MGFLSRQAMGRTILNLLEKYQWTTVYAIIDECSFPLYDQIMKMWLTPIAADVIHFYQRQLTCDKMLSFGNQLNEISASARGIKYTDYIYSL